MKKIKKVIFVFLLFFIAGSIWLPCLNFLFKVDINSYRTKEGIAPKTQLLAQRQMRNWENYSKKEKDISKMRVVNAEWDFMGRTFFVLSLANMACMEPSKTEEYLNTIDRVIDDTLELEKKKGKYYFLMDYARDSEFLSKQKRSIFIDGEIALMLGARRLLEEKQTYKKEMEKRITLMISQMKQSPVLSAESYPDECWLFCNTAAIASIKIGDILGTGENVEFINEWLEVLKANFIEPKTGLLYSSYSVDGNIYQGPEGSSIWFAAHCLQLVDEVFARTQYRLAKEELARHVMDFGYAKEWPSSYKTGSDVDSGPVIPFLEISAGSSGLAFVAAGAFDDDIYLQKLLTAVQFAGFPIEKNGELKYGASNQVGDAVLLYGLVVGPLWEKAKSLEANKYEKVE
ncbi:MAG: hypothetical protein KAI43_02840 [Candidatus Aureabacteria bacterium]|nr:hypothetical protein [Candidatus Auribacterota bacterium]